MTEEASHPGIDWVAGRFGDDVVERDAFNGQPWITVRPERIHDVLEGLKAETGFDFLEDLTAVDYLDRPDVEGRFRVVYQLLDMERRELLRVKALVEDEDVEVPTVSDLYGTADWLEREVWDMFGIRFAGHPNLTRILMDQDFEGFPCRRDFPWHGRVPIHDPMREQDYDRGVAGEHRY